MKRIFLFLAANFAIMLAMSVVFNVVCAFLGMDPAEAYKTTGLNLQALALWSLVYGMAGSVM